MCVWNGKEGYETCSWKKKRRIIAYVAKKLMDNDIVMAKFLCFDIKVSYLTHETTTTMNRKLKTDITRRLIMVSVILNT